MKIITGLAYFLACDKCGMHGVVVIPQRKERIRVESKERAYEVMKDERLKLGTTLSVDEYSIIMEQIANSSMPEFMPVLEALIEAEEEFLTHLAGSDEFEESEELGEAGGVFN